MDSPAVRAKVTEHAERLSRLTLGDRKKAEAEDRAFMAESLGGGGEIEESGRICCIFSCVEVTVYHMTVSILYRSTTLNGVLGCYIVGKVWGGWLLDL